MRCYRTLCPNFAQYCFLLLLLSRHFLDDCGRNDFEETISLCKRQELSFIVLSHSTFPQLPIQALRHKANFMITELCKDQSQGLLNQTIQPTGKTKDDKTGNAKYEKSPRDCFNENSTVIVQMQIQLLRGEKNLGHTKHWLLLLNSSMLLHSNYLLQYTKDKQIHS